MRPIPRSTDNKTHLLLEAASKRFKASYSAGRFSEALAQSIQATRLAPALALPWSDAAVCCVKLERWDEAIAYGLRAVECKSSELATYDALAHAYGVKNDRQEMRRWGQQALDLRVRKFFAEAPISQTPAPLPPAPSPATRERNIIAFSLFGGLAKYCECAVLNVIERPRIYPDWTCRFFIDDSVPQSVVQRLQAAGSEVQHVGAEQQQRWPGPMWRFLAYDSADLHRVIFRDADSVISERESRAVDEWISSGKHFHIMRDAPTHTELIMAGLWGVTGGALPPMTSSINHFLKKPLRDPHFADQHFLREYVWPHAHTSLLQHDSLFGFLDALEFPSGPTPSNIFEQVGSAEASTLFHTATHAADGTPVKWTLYRIAEVGGQRSEVPICSYPTVIRNGMVTDNLPNRYAKLLDSGEMIIRVTL